jgi:ribosomal protein L3 glutamine methyltransferase
MDPKIDILIDELRTPRDFVRWGASRFNEAGLYFGHGTDNAVDEANVLVLHALHLPPGIPDELMRANLTREERRDVLRLLRRRIDERVPVPYLTREAWFAGLAFYVDERVLVPRSLLGEVIEEGFSPWLDTVEVDRVLDLGTGSGCIAIACALAFPGATVDAVDVSAEALEVARINVERHGVEDRVRLVHSDLFAALPPARYRLIVSNPPYVDAEELRRMPPEYGREPRLGLAAGADGLDVVRRILTDAAEWLARDGVLVVEVGASRPALEQAYPEVPFTWLELERGPDEVFLLTARDLRALARGAPPVAGGPAPTRRRKP